jgi:hypothetical protein
MTHGQVNAFLLGIDIGVALVAVFIAAFKKGTR